MKAAQTMIDYLVSLIFPYIILACGAALMFSKLFKNVFYNHYLLVCIPISCVISFLFYFIIRYAKKGKSRFRSYFLGVFLFHLNNAVLFAIVMSVLLPKITLLPVSEVPAWFHFIAYGLLWMSFGMLTYIDVVEYKEDYVFDFRRVKTWILFLLSCCTYAFLSPLKLSMGGVNFETPLESALTFALFVGLIYLVAAATTSWQIVLGEQKQDYDQELVQD